jgi:hypothetical protein
MIKNQSTGFVDRDARVREQTVAGRNSGTTSSSSTASSPSPPKVTTSLHKPAFILPCVQDKNTHGYYHSTADCN